MQFGTSSEAFIRQRSRAYLKKDMPVAPFQVREKELAGELTADEIESTMATVRERWASHGLSLPEIALL